MRWPRLFGPARAGNIKRSWIGTELPTVAVCAIFKNEAPYLREWLTYYRLLGVTEFHLYDNGSTDDWRARTGWDINVPPDVHLYDFPGHGVQEEAYENCLAFQARADWIAFIDVDEYLWHPVGRTLPEALAREDADGLYVPWRMFGDGGHAVASSLPTIDAFLRCSPTERSGLGKSVVRRLRVVEVQNPHAIRVRGKLSIDPELRLNHYWTRSTAEVQAKFARGRATHERRRTWRDYTRVRAELNTSVDPRLSLMWGLALRAALAEGPPNPPVD